LAALIPVVLMSSSGEGMDFSSVCVNEFQAHRSVYEHLMELGHRRIAYFSGARNFRYEIVVRLMKELGLEIVPEWIEPIPFVEPEGTEEAILEALRRYGAGATKPTAIVTEDLSLAVIGDNLRILEGGRMQLTAVRYPMMEMGRWAVEEAARFVEDKHRPAQHLSINAVLIKRASCAPPAAA
jgi:DNA-binding LacI/PurR family transcriptional regulator